MFLKPSEIRFSQDSIGNSFGGYTSHPFRRIGQTLDDILSGCCNVDSIPRISVMNRNGLYFNRPKNAGKLRKFYVSVTFYIKFQ